MTVFDRNRISATAADLPPALENALSQAISPISGEGASPFLLGFDAEAADLEGLVEATFYRVTGLLAEHQAQPITCLVHGLHETDEGHRVWGMLECTIGEGAIPSTRVDDVRVEQTIDGRWQVAFRITQGLDDDLLGQRGRD